MSVGPVQMREPEQTPGYVETKVQQLAGKVGGFLQKRGWVKPPEPLPEPKPLAPLPESKPGAPPPPAHSFERRLLKKAERQTMAPWMVRRQFRVFVPLAVRRDLYEKWGRAEPLGCWDRFLNRAVRDARAVRQHYREVGRERMERDAYLGAPALKQALAKIISSSVSSPSAHPST